jgi:hypothetical protein
MAKRPRPDLNQVRDAMRDRDEREEQEEQEEAPPPREAPEDGAPDDED